jgi:hypothetical protein
MSLGHSHPAQQATAPFFGLLRAVQTTKLAIALRKPFRNRFTFPSMLEAVAPISRDQQSLRVIADRAP